MSKNVCILVLFAIFGSVLSLPADISDSDVDMACVAEAQIQYRELLQYETLQMGYTYDKKIACYNLCVGKKDGSINDDGTFSLEGAKKQMGKLNAQSEQIANEIFSKCKDKKIIGDPCKTLYESTNCLVNQVFESFLDIIRPKNHE